MLRKQPAERPSGTEVLSFINAQTGFAQGASMPHQIVKRPSETVTPIVPEPETLSRASGQGASSRKRVARLSLVFTAAVVALVAVGALVRSVVSSGGDKKTAAQTVRIRIDSTPSNAEVLRQRDMQPIGRTPFLREQPAAAGSESLLLRLPGHADRPVTLDLNASRELTLVLSPLSEPAKPAAVTPTIEEKAPPRTKPTAIGKGKRRTGKTTNADIDFIK